MKSSDKKNNYFKVIKYKQCIKELKYIISYQVDIKW